METGKRQSPRVVVVVDAIRAFTTAAHLVNLGSHPVYCAANVSEARQLAKRVDHMCLVGEDARVRPDDFAFGNSPSSLRMETLDGRPAVLVTSKGTRALVNQAFRGDVYACAAVNVSATAESIGRSRPASLSFVPTGRTDEDQACILAIQRILRGERLHREELHAAVLSGAEQRIRELGDMTREQVRQFMEDAELCADVDAFDFALRARRDAGAVILEAHLP